MARDRFDDADDFDDRPARRDRDDDFDDDRDDRRPGRRRDVRASAKAKTKVPGIFLMIVGVVSGLLTMYSLVMALTNPNQVVDQYEAEIKKIEADQPAGAQRDAQVNAIRTLQKWVRLDSPAILGFIALSGLSSLLMVLGGYSLTSLSGYILGVLGSVAAILSCNQCLCLTLPFGVWGLIVLLNSDVKAAFGARRPGPSLES